MHATIHQDLEKELLVEENKLRDVQDSVQEKGQMGFLRMAAQVENFRKTSGAGTGDYEADAKSAVLKAMLPAFEPFEAAEEVTNFINQSEQATEQLFVVVGGTVRKIVVVERKSGLLRCSVFVKDVRSTIGLYSKYELFSARLRCCRLQHAG